MLNLFRVIQWIDTSDIHRLGDTIHVATTTSRRRALVIATAPGRILIRFHL
jgi:hypothetical protein